MRHYLTFTALILMPLRFLSAIDSIYDDHPEIKDPKIIIDLQLANLEKIKILAGKSIENLNRLQQMISDYKKNQNAYLEHPDNKELLYHMAKSANVILNKIKADELADSFDIEFINELQLLAQIYSKLTLPKIS